MDKTSVAMLIGAFVALIIGASLIGTIAGESNKYTKTVGVINETFSIVNSAGVDGEVDADVNYSSADLGGMTSADTFPDNDCIISIYNSTTGVLTKDTDYKIYCSEGLFSFMNTTVTSSIITTDNNTKITYQYEKPDYLQADWNRTVLDLVPGFFALMMMAMAVGLALGVMKREGVV